MIQSEFFGGVQESTYEQLFWEIVRFLMRQLSGNGAGVTHVRFFPDIWSYILDPFHLSISEDAADRVYYIGDSPQGPSHAHIFVSLAEMTGLKVTSAIASLA